MNTEELKKELLDTYTQYYIEGFKTNDVTLIDQMVRYPITYVKDGVVKTMDHYPIDPNQLKTDTGWDHSIDWQFDIPAISETSAHAFASATRCRVDGSVIERVHGFYSFTKVDGRWKMYAVADIVY